MSTSFVHRWFPALVAFVAASIASGLLVWYSEHHRVTDERRHFSEIVDGHADSIQRQLERTLSATYALAALVRENKGHFSSFDAIAGQMLSYYPGAASLQLAPGGIVRHIVPLAGNEKAIGHDLFKDPARSKEAIAARDTGQLTLAGPFDLVQGGMGAVGRLPVFLEDGAKKRVFWGFANVLIRFPDLLKEIPLLQAENRSFHYELWRTHPDTGKKQVIAATSHAALTDPVDHHIQVPGAKWTLSAVPVGGWGDATMFGLKIVLGLLFSSLVAATVRLLFVLKAHQRGLEALVAERTAEVAARELDLTRAQSIAKTGSWRFNQACDEMQCTAEASRIFGLPAVSSIHRDVISQMIHGDDRAAVEQAWQAAKKGAGYDIVHRIVVLDQVRWVHVRVELVIDEDGTLKGGVGTVHDITERKVVEDALLESERRYRAITESAKDAIISGDANGDIVSWNPAAESIFGYTVAEALNQPLTMLMPERIRDQHRRGMRRLLAGGVPHMIGKTVVLTGQRKGGAEFPLELSLAQWKMAEGRFFSGIIRDVSERVRAEAAMREALVVLNASSQAIITTDTAGVITSVNPAFCTITGYSAQEVIGKNSSILKSGRHDAAFFEAMWASLAASGTWEGEIWNRRHNGEIYPQWQTISAVRDAGGEVVEYVALFSDITERKRQEELVWRQANFDSLTGLANRSMFRFRLENALARARRGGKRIGVLFLDLDGFKTINDSLGHDIGDQLLIEVAERLKRCVRDADTVARLGGDEFTFVVQDMIDNDSLQAVAEKVVGVLREPFILSGSSHQLSGSVGITIFPDDGEDMQTLLKNADMAMYKSKQFGKNRFHFYAQDMQVEALAHMQIKYELRAAIRNEEFVLYYQPIVDAVSGEMIGAEALIRWQHPERGLVSPQEFIPLCEDGGLIVTIGEWVIREAVRQWQRWQQIRSSSISVPLYLAVNVSGIQFQESGLSELVATVLTEYNMEPGMLILEITEAVLMSGSISADARVRGIKSLGVRYALDDFGTGLSPIYCLKSYPIDVIKIDGCYVAECDENTNMGHFVEAIINMAHGLDMRVVAEGVESDVQARFLRAKGCDFLQGFLFCKPVPAAEFEALITPARSE